MQKEDHRHDNFEMLEVSGVSWCCQLGHYGTYQGVYVSISIHVSPCRLVLEGIYVVVVAIIAGNAPGKGLSLYGVV